MIGNRLIAVVDILGFSALTLNRPTIELSLLLRDLFEFSRRLSAGISFYPVSDSAEEPFSCSMMPGVCQFSDTVLFWSDLNTAETTSQSPRQASQYANMFFQLISNFISQSLLHSIPLRAGISFGETFIDSPACIYVGEPIVRAHQLESDQDWIGATVDATALQSLEHYGWVTDYQVPSKGGNIPGRAVRWTSTLAGAQSILRAFEVINCGLKNSSERSVIRKYENTKQFMTAMLKDATTVDGKCILEQVE